MSELLFPTNGISSVSQTHTLPKGVHTFPFQMELPLFSTCPSAALPRHCELTLPPSFFARVPNRGTVEARYFLEAKVRRPGAFRWDITSKQEIQFVPLDPPLFSILEISGPSAMSQCLLMEEGSGQTRTLATGMSQNSNQTKLLELRAELPSPAVLYSEETVPLRLFLTKSHLPDRSIPVLELRDLSICLRSRLNATATIESASSTSTKDLYRSSGQRIQALNLGATEEEIDITPVERFMIPKLAPSFTSCIVRQDYSMEVIAKFAFVNESKPCVCLPMHISEIEGPDTDAHLDSQCRPERRDPFRNGKGVSLSGHL